MIDKLRSLGNVGHDIESLRKEVRKLKAESSQGIESIKKTRESLEELNSKQGEARQQQEGQLEEMRVSMEEFRQLKEDMRKELCEIKLMRSQLSKDIMKKLDSDLREMLDKQFGSLKEDISRYNRLKENLQGISCEVDSLVKEVHKFKEIGRTVKETDFHLNKYYRNLEDMDKEKLRLLKKIDHLERMVAKSRRN